MLGNLDGARFLVILIVAMLVLGPERLPEVMRRAAQLVGKLKQFNERLQAEVHGSLGEPLAAAQKLRTDLNDVAQDFRTAAHAAITSASSNEGQPPSDDARTPPPPPERSPEVEMQPAYGRTHNEQISGGDAVVTTEAEQEPATPECSQGSIEPSGPVADSPDDLSISRDRSNLGRACPSGQSDAAAD